VPDGLPASAVAVFLSLLELIMGRRTDEPAAVWGHKISNRGITDHFLTWRSIQHCEAPTATWGVGSVEITRPFARAPGTTF